jgi:hypothetical protein
VHDEIERFLRRNTFRTPEDAGDQGNGKKWPGRDDPLQKILVGQIALQNEGRAPSCFDIRTDRIERRAVGEDEIGTEFGQTNGGSPSDTAGGS